MSTTQLPSLPQSLPKTQADWQRLVNVLQTWAQAIQQNEADIAGLQTASLTNPGYEANADGVIRQWGTLLSVSTGIQQTITFPIPFTTQVGSLVCTLKSPAFASNTVFTGGLTLTGFAAQIAGPAGTSDICWEAVGS